MKLSSIRIVLVATSHPGNIGSTARAMKTMGLQSLYLVTPNLFPHRQASELAAGADDILDNAIICDSLSEALSDCQWVVGTSARSRDMDLPLISPASCAKLINSASDKANVAIVFGREHAGLTNDELLQCQYHLHIPTDPTFSSLNLAQAVQIIAYELRVESLNESLPIARRTHPLASIGDVERLYEHMQELLVAIDFLKPSNPKKLIQRLRRLFNRAKLEQTEVTILRGILTHVFNALKKNR